MIKKNSNRSLRKIPSFKSSSSIRIKSLPRISSHCSIAGIESQFRYNSIVKQIKGNGNSKLNITDNSVSYSLEEEMNKLNNLALRNQNKHNDWLNIQQKIIEIHHNSQQKENIYYPKPLNIDKVIEKYSTRTILKSRNINF